MYHYAKLMPPKFAEKPQNRSHWLSLIKQIRKQNPSVKNADNVRKNIQEWSDNEIKYIGSVTVSGLNIMYISIDYDRKNKDIQEQLIEHVIGIA